MSIGEKDHIVHDRRFTTVFALRRRLSLSLVVALLAAACVPGLLHSASASSHPLTPKSGGGADISVPWVHYATASNTYASWTNMDEWEYGNPTSDPNALIFVTRVWNPGGVYASAFDASNVGVWYNTATHKWSIFNEDNSPMPIGAAFNVYFPLSVPHDPAVFVSTATAATISGSSFDIINPATDGQPNAGLLITPTWNGVYDNHSLGVFYHYETGHWAIFHEDGAPMTSGAAHNIDASPNTTHYVHAATGANSQYAYTQLDASGPQCCIPVLNGHPNAIVLVTQRWSEKHCFQTTYGPICTWPTAFNSSAVSLFYQALSQRWCIYNDTGVPVPVTAQFDVVFDNAFG